MKNTILQRTQGTELNKQKELTNSGRHPFCGRIAQQPASKRTRFIVVVGWQLLASWWLVVANERS